MPTFEGDHASHNGFVDILGQAHVVLSDPGTGEATLYALTVGEGLLIVSGLPWESQGGEMAGTMQTLTDAMTMGWGYP